MHRKDVKILFRVGAYTGMRLKDCVLVKWSDINFTRNTINVKPYKTNKHITVPMHPDLLAVLKSANKKNEYVMPDLADRYFRNPSGVDKTSCRVIWYALESKHVPGKLPDRIKGYGFHSLRHSFVSFCANAGVPLAVVQEIVGHNNVAVTRIYAHFAPETLRQAIDALPGRKSAPMRPEKKLKQIKELLDGGKLTAREKKILEVLGK
jgi:integrase